MSREIKFRVWNADSKKYWNIENWHIEDEYIDLIDPNNSNADPNAKRIWKRESDVVIEQFTGLKDANGKEIYEGDILEFQDFVFGGKPRSKRTIVEWSEGDAAFVTGFRNLWKLVELGAVVVGNVHEDPELLGGHDVRNQE